MLIIDVCAVAGLVTGGAISLALYYRTRWLVEHERAKTEQARAKKWNAEFLEHQAMAKVLHHHLNQERLRSDALMRTNFEMAKANECMQGQIERFRSLPAWSQTIVFN